MSNKLVKKSYYPSVWDNFNSMFDLFFGEINWPTNGIFNETDKEVSLKLNLAGFKKDEIKITTKENTLKVSAQNKDSNYYRSFYLSNWDLSKVEPKLENGVLSLTAPKVSPVDEKVVELK
jgi:HSP20 family molecular chaperone IbpA